ncbi:FAST kinase domain-containing protein 5, mitochondrial [Linepithema humile]|uniref:FAST kinase domain-containing protein 5, mitochondrial n=1 Tax=Linepithema humile TaxID=83485 RepID=UPI000623306E|nr:PREDICTED: FAST kinase domain-containing protein 5 [Linepithema humile]
MSVFAQKFSSLRCTYSMLLRLCDKRKCPQWVGTLKERRFSALTWSRVHYAICNWDNLRRSHQFPLPATDQKIVDKFGSTINFTSDQLKENDYAHNLFLSSLNYKDTVMQPSMTYAHVTNEEALRILEKDWSAPFTKNEEILSVIKKLSYNISSSKESIDRFKYKDVFNALSTQYEKLSDKDLIILMRYIIPFQKHLKDCNFYQNFCEQVDRECTARFLQLNIQETLLLCDILYQMKKIHSIYIWHSIKKLGNRPSKLKPHQLVQILFFLNVCRKPPINMYELEYRLEQCIDDLSINELGIAALGFFKTGTQIKSANFVTRIIKKTITEMEAVSTVSIGALLKIIRYSMQLTELKTFEDLCTALIPHLPRFTLMSLTHISHACARGSWYDKELMDIIITRFNSELKTARLKDIERLIFSFVSLNIDSNIYQNVVEELRATWDTSRAREISLFPQVAARTLGYLARKSIYPTDLIQCVMTPAFINKVCYNNHRFLTAEYCVLDYSLRLEVPEYQGPFLKPATCSFLEKKHFEAFVTTTATHSHANLLLTSVLETCQEIFNTTSNISAVRPLPHYAQLDIIFCLDEQNQLVPSEEFISQFKQGEFKRVDKDSKNVRWIALVLASQSLLIRNTNLPIGLLVAKMRQLSIIGYTPIMVSYISWKKCISQQDKCDYIRNLVFKNNLSKQCNT